MQRFRLVLPIALLSTQLAQAQLQPAGTPADPEAGNSVPLVAPGERNPSSGGEPARFPLPANTVPALPAENLVSFDYRMTELRWEQGRWQVVAGGTVLKDFGRRDVEARQALRLVRELRLTQHGTIGTPRPVMEYWLADGRAPQGTVAGLKTVPIDLSSVRVEQTQDQWCLRDAQRPLFNFGSHADEARQALEVVKRHGFNQVGFLGQATPSMLVLWNDPNASPAAHVAAPTSLARPGPQMILKEMPLKPNADAQQPFPTANPKPTGLPGGLRVNHAAGGPGNPSTTSVPPFPVSRQLAAPATALPSLADLGERVPFDWRQVQLRHDGPDWKLVMGSYALASFGNDERAARQALGAVKFYRVTEHCLIGHPKPAFSYYLTNGQAPRGLMFGLSAVPFRADSLEVRTISDNNWAICDGSRYLLVFGDKADEAKHALQAIQRFQFDHLCQIGQPGQGGMTVLVRAR